MIKTGDELTIGDEIRKWCASENDTECGGFVTKVSFDELSTLADRIDAEMFELPRDRDGVPIHVGDTVYLDDGRTAKVTRIGIGMDEDSIYTVVYGDDFSLTPGYVTHERPDSFERIADELEAWCNSVDVNGDTCKKPRDLADRIRKLSEKED